MDELEQDSPNQINYFTDDFIPTNEESNEWNTLGSSSWEHPAVLFLRSLRSFAAILLCFVLLSGGPVSPWAKRRVSAESKRNKE